MKSIVCRTIPSCIIVATATVIQGFTVTQTDIADRPIIQTDGEGNETTTTYTACCNNPASITDALGNTVNYSYKAPEGFFAWGIGETCEAMFARRASPQWGGDESTSVTAKSLKTPEGFFCLGD